LMKQLLPRQKRPIRYERCMNHTYLLNNGKHGGCQLRCAQKEEGIFGGRMRVKSTEQGKAPQCDLTIEGNLVLFLATPVA
jgi:hypothetical protein